MRIGLFSDVYEPTIGGVSTSVKMLKEGFEKKGHKVYVVTPNLEGLRNRYDEKERILRLGSVPSGIYKDIRLANTYILKGLKRIENWNLDIIHIHTEANIGNLGKKVARKMNIPLVYTYHTLYESAVGYVTKGLFNNAAKKALKSITKAFCQNIDEIIAPGEKVYKLLKEKYEVEPNVTVVPNGIDVERFHKEKISKKLIDSYKENLEIEKEDFVILYLGRVAFEKSVDFLISPMKKIIKNNKNVKLLIVGGGPDEEKLHRLTQKYKLQNHIIFTGSVPWNTVPEYYQLGDVYVTASKFENHSMTMIEAMAASLPVVCINDESFSVMVTDGVNGKIFKSKKEYVEIMEGLIRNPNTIKKMKSEALKTSDIYSAKNYSDNVMKVYEKALSRIKKKRFRRIKNAINLLKRDDKR